MIEPLEGRVLLSHQWTYIHNQVFIGQGVEALELLGKSYIVFNQDNFLRGTTNCRLNTCSHITFINCNFSQVIGPADPDGHDLQLINCSSITITECKFFASRDSEDLLNIFSDKPIPGLITVDHDTFSGHGKSLSSNAICLDGPYSTKTLITSDTIEDQRCGLTVASNIAILHDTTFVDCQTNTYVSPIYHTQALLIVKHR